MDITSIIESKINGLPNSFSKQGIESVLRHIRVAEEHFQRGVQTGADYLFNDVVYRTNQAFEGGLKEAFKILSKSSEVENVSAFNIEKYFEKGKVFNYRVMELFSNYRQKWRNETTHDHSTQISEEEAFLAISFVSAFVSILVDQIVSKVAEQQELKIFEPEPVFSEKPASFFEGVSQHLVNFSYHILEMNRANAFPISAVTEAYMVGQLVGFFEKHDASTRVEQEPVYKYENKRVRPDLRLMKDEQELLIEVKRSNSKTMQRLGIEQLQRYLEATGLSEGILYFPPHEGQSEVQKELKVFEVNGRQIYIMIIW